MVTMSQIPDRIWFNPPLDETIKYPLFL
uniref:Uncharacterized protein n=1 Tax=Rhizophora mucronata TaxID=61149 RepID=A0A2P2NRK5_RHIMU